MRYRAVEITVTDSLFFCFHDEAEPLFLGSSRYQPALLIAVQLDQDRPIAPQARGIFSVVLSGHPYNPSTPADLVLIILAFPPVTIIRKCQP